MTKIQKIVTFLVVLVLALGALYWFFYLKDDSTPLSQNTENQNSTSTSGSVTSGQVQIETSTGEKITGVDTSKLPPAPSLERKVSYSASITADVRPIFEQKIATVVSDIKKNPYSLEGWLNLGIYYKQVGDYQAAKDAWEYASLISPGNTVSFNNLGDLYHYYLKDYPKAEKNFLVAIKNDKKYILSYVNLFDLYRYSYQVNTTKAADTLKQAIAANPESIDLYVTLANYYKEKGDKANARIYYEQALVKAKAANNTQLTQSLEAELQALK